MNVPTLEPYLSYCVAVVFVIVTQHSDAYFYGKIVFEKEGIPFVPTASTGQKRLIALILRTGQAVFYKQITSRKPVLLMDDVLLELDPEKRQKVTSLLPEYDQLFCTFLPGEPYKNYKRESTRVYKIQDGKWEDSE